MGFSPDDNSNISLYGATERVKKITIKKGGTIEEYKVEYNPYDKQLVYHLFLPTVFLSNVFFCGYIYFNTCSILECRNERFNLFSALFRNELH